MNDVDALAHEFAPEPGLVEVPSGDAGLPALFGETYRNVQGPVVGDDRRLHALQLQLREHRNPLVAAAAPLLDLILVLAEGARHDSPRELRMQVASEIRAFHRRLEQHSVSLHSMRVASYALCIALDEAVLTTDWGSDSDWSTNTLLWAFHRDSTGGENFFRYVADLARIPDSQVELMELLVVLLDLGFQGRHRLSHDGTHALETMRIRLHAVVRASRCEAPSPVGIAASVTRKGPSPWRAAMGVFMVCVALALLAAYATLYTRTQALVEPLVAEIELLLNAYPSPGAVGTVPSD